MRNEFKLERVIGHERSEDGSECITLYEDVKFIEQYIPNPPQLVSTAVIASCCCLYSITYLTCRQTLSKKYYKRNLQRRKKTLM